MTDNDTHSGPSRLENPATKEECRFQRIRDHIPIHLHPLSVPQPLSNLSTAANLRFARIYRTADGDHPSDKLEAAIFIDELSTQAFIRISKDRRYAYVIGPNDFTASEHQRSENVKLLVFVVSTAAGGNRALGVYRSCNVNLLDITEDESFYQDLPEEVKIQFQRGPIPCTGLVFDSFDNQTQNKIREATVVVLPTSPHTSSKTLASERRQQVLEDESTTSSGSFRGSGGIGSLPHEDGKEVDGEGEGVSRGSQARFNEVLGERLRDSHIQVINNPSKKGAARELYELSSSSLATTGQPSRSPEIERPDVEGRRGEVEGREDNEGGASKRPQDKPTGPSGTDLDTSRAMKRASIEPREEIYAPEWLSRMVSREIRSIAGRFGRTDAESNVETPGQQSIDFQARLLLIYLCLSARPLHEKRDNQAVHAIRVMSSNRGDEGKVGGREITGGVAANDQMSTPVTRDKRKRGTPSSGGSDKPGQNSRGEAEADLSLAARLQLNYNPQSNVDQHLRKRIKKRRYSEPILPHFGVQVEAGAEHAPPTTRTTSDSSQRTNCDKSLQLLSEKVIGDHETRLKCIVQSNESPIENLPSNLRGGSNILHFTSTIPPSALGPSSTSAVVPSFQLPPRATWDFRQDLLHASPTPRPNATTYKPVSSAVGNKPPQQHTAAEAANGKSTDGGGADSANRSWLQIHQARQGAHPHSIGSSQTMEVGTSVSAGSVPPTGLSGDAISILKWWRTVLFDIDDGLLAAAGLRIAQPSTSDQTGRQVFSDEETLLNILKSSRSVLSTLPSEALEVAGVAIIHCRPRPPIPASKDPEASSGGGNMTGPHAKAAGSHKASSGNSVIRHDVPEQNQPENEAASQERTWAASSKQPAHRGSGEAPSEASATFIAILTAS
ncbi:hypothetical protein FRC01_013846 [Tulasnella sp. 417]|nr:hypothetical protein FRC01_013846 [Tulasnella sp. 417]